MSDDSKKKAVRVTLTKTQAAEGLGRDLLDLSRTWLADGKLDARELEQLKAWLGKVPPDSLPAIRFLREEVEQYIADGEVYEWELARLHAALMRVVPLKDREEAKAARDFAARREWMRHDPEEREAARRASAERSQALRERYAEKWAQEPATEPQLDYIRDLGGAIAPSASKLEASETIDRLLGREVTAVRPGAGCLSLVALVLLLSIGVSFFA